MGEQIWQASLLSRQVLPEQGSGSSSSVPVHPPVAVLDSSENSRVNSVTPLPQSSQTLRAPVVSPFHSIDKAVSHLQATLPAPGDVTPKTVAKANNWALEFGSFGRAPSPPPSPRAFLFEDLPPLISDTDDECIARGILLQAQPRTAPSVIDLTLSSQSPSVSHISSSTAGGTRETADAPTSTSVHISQVRASNGRFTTASESTSAQGKRSHSVLEDSDDSVVEVPPPSRPKRQRSTKAQIVDGLADFTQHVKQQDERQLEFAQQSLKHQEELICIGNRMVDVMASLVKQ
jgi:hypothetical protein